MFYYIIATVKGDIEKVVVFDGASCGQTTTFFWGGGFIFA